MTDQLTNFEARLRRIKDPKNISWHDPETGMNIPRYVSRAAIKSSAQDIKKIGPMAILLSVLLGIVCLMAGRFARYHFAGMDGSGYAPEVILGADIGLGLIVAVIAGTVLGLGRGKLQIAQLVGILLMAVSMHNLVWAFPEEATQLYGPDFVAETLADTQPRSIMLRGTVIAL